MSKWVIKGNEGKRTKYAFSYTQNLALMLYVHIYVMKAEGDFLVEGGSSIGKGCEEETAEGDKGVT